MQPFKGEGKIGLFGKKCHLVCQIIVISTLNSHKRIAGADGLVVLLANFSQVAVKKGKTKPKKEAVLLVGAEAREMKGLQPLFFFILREVKFIQFCNTLGRGGEHLGNCLHFRR